jgi:hypothetical protein
VHRYAFDPAQEHKLGVGQGAIDVPRGLEFLLSLNRVNVFIFHASRLAILVGNPAPLSVGRATPERMCLAFRRFGELAWFCAS